MHLVLLLIVLVLGVVFAVQNADVVTLNALFWRLDASLAVIIVLCFAIGALIAALAMAGGLYRSHQGARRLKARISELESGPLPLPPGDAAEQQSPSGYGHDRPIADDARGLK